MNKRQIKKMVKRCGGEWYEIPRHLDNKRVRAETRKLYPEVFAMECYCMPAALYGGFNVIKMMDEICERIMRGDVVSTESSEPEKILTHEGIEEFKTALENIQSARDARDDALELMGLKGKMVDMPACGLKRDVPEMTAGVWAECREILKRDGVDYI